MFLSFTLQQNLMPVILQEASASGHIAFVSLAVVYAVFMPACLVVPTMLRSISPRSVLPMGTASYAFYALSAAGPAAVGPASSLVRLCATAALLFAAVLIGASAAVVWICHGHIMTHISPQRMLNRYIAFFFTVLNSSSIVGAVAADRFLGRPAGGPWNMVRQKWGQINTN